jgi:hypothetical protein
LEISPRILNLNLSVARQVIKSGVKSDDVPDNATIHALGLWHDVPVNEVHELRYAQPDIKCGIASPQSTTRAILGVSRHGAVSGRRGRDSVGFSGRLLHRFSAIVARARKGLFVRAL